VPVIPAIAHRFLIPNVRVSFRDYYSDPEIMLHTKILAQKWLMENIRTDAYSITLKTANFFSIYCYFSNEKPAGGYLINKVSNEDVSILKTKFFSNHYR
jgi:hypothetical protein